ncbi:MAG: hypothetical protein E6767_10570 [Dysgonomonas sp.]|nr:hypothetical protein [Dysgonomonas sp.]
MKRLTILFFILLLFCVSQSAAAQVTIGLDEEALLGALLQLKTEKVAGNAVNAKQGLLLPRVKLDMSYSPIDNTNQTQVSECFLKSLGISSPTTAGTDAKQHEGLTIYNILTQTASNAIFMDKKICPGIYTWTGTQWERSMSDYCL